MPPEPILDVSEIDQSKVAVTREQIYQVNPHRYEFQQLDGIFFLDFDRNVIAGFRDVREDEFWVRGHIPGRPIFPGVLMIESAAQLFSYYVVTREKYDGFIGFGGVDNVKFRGQVVPGDRVIILGRMVEVRKRRCVGAVQGFVDGRMVFEGTITGMLI
ncbi:MAG: 3-hydroxyacyl-ACP dehydratase FabZ family protein [Planctomycetota bacterium]|nr:3-hydroxyacyl-ACP dehydratase FabZ family protein [Planctomycetota bacterium]